MLRNNLILLAVILLAFATLANAGPVGTIITVYPTLGPNYWGSPSYDAFAQNVINGILASSSSEGSGYAAYNVIGVVSPNQPIVSNFESWEGALAPGSGEYGTALYFAVHILSSELFSLSQMSFDGWDPYYGLYHWDYTSDEYATDRIGRLAGGSWITSGAGTQQVNELIYVGEFVGYEAASGTGDDQGALDEAAQCIGCCCGEFLTGQYTVTIPGATSFSGDAAVPVGGEACDVPEPGTAAIAAMGLAALMLVRRRRAGV
jgi:hypothetical protein